MKVKGDITTMDFVSRDIPDIHIQEPRVVFLVKCEGDWEVWFNKTPKLRKMDIEKCKGELELYYRRDWAGTGRVLPMLIMTLAEYHSINCLGSV